MIELNLFQRLLEDPMYKKHTENLSDEEREQIEEYMKTFMDSMQDNLLSPFASVANNDKTKKEFNELLKKRQGKKGK